MVTALQILGEDLCSDDYNDDDEKWYVHVYIKITYCNIMYCRIGIYRNNYYMNTQISVKIVLHQVFH